MTAEVHIHFQRGLKKNQTWEYTKLHQNLILEVFQKKMSSGHLQKMSIQEHAHSSLMSKITCSTQMSRELPQKFTSEFTIAQHCVATCRVTDGMDGQWWTTQTCSHIWSKQSRLLSREDTCQRSFAYLITCLRSNNQFFLIPHYNQRKPTWAVSKSCQKKHVYLIHLNTGMLTVNKNKLFSPFPQLQWHSPFTGKPGKNDSSLGFRWERHCNNFFSNSLMCSTSSFFFAVSSLCLFFPMILSIQFFESDSSKEIFTSMYMVCKTFVPPKQNPENNLAPPVSIGRCVYFWGGPLFQRLMGNVPRTWPHAIYIYISIYSL